MVIAAMSALAMDSLSHIVGEGPLINAEKEFDRFTKSYEFAIEAQKLKREDIKSLMELVVDRMDMYHLIGALLLEFCVGFYGEFKMLEQDYVNEPKLIMEIFLLSNIAAVGYLLFAIWLSLHASVAAHAIGVEFLLDCNRLTVPTPDNLREMREATSMFRSTYRLFQKLQRNLSSGDAAMAALNSAAAGSGSATAGAGGDKSVAGGLGAFGALGMEQKEVQKPPKELTLEALATTGQPLVMPRINDDLQKLEHRAKFAQHHRAWLRFDAYSRVSMALGINQMLQSMSYFIAGPVQKHRPSFALITVIGVQAIAFFLVKLDWRSMDTDESDDEGEFQRTKKKDVSSLPLIDFFAISVTNLLPPVWMVLILWLAHFIDSTDEGNLDHQGRITARVLATPIFFLHAAWLYLVRWYIAPHQHDLLPVRLRTVGYLDVFMRDAKLVHEQEEEDLEQEVEAFPQPRRRKSTRCRHNEAAMKTVVCCDSVEDLWTSHEWEEDYLASVETSGRRAKSRGRKTPEPQSPDVEAAKGHAPSECQQCLVPKRKRPRGHDHVAWLVVGRFTTVMIWLWIGGGFIHITNSLLDLEGTPKDLNGNIQDQVRRELGPPRKLLAQWPEPARFFEVTKLHCNSSSVVIGTPFNVHTAPRADEGLGPLAQIGEFEMKAAWCEPGRCRALEKRGRQWQLRSLGEGSLPALLDVLPESWELLAAAPAVPPIWRSPPGAAGGAAAPVLLAAWDGERVVISRLEETDRRWRLHRRFAVHPSNCSQADDGGRPQVQGLYLDTSGCETLTVLRGRALEGWDLVAGTSLGCWKISAEDHGEYSAVCHDSSNLLLARHGSEGPILEAAGLPDTFTHCRVSGQDSALQA